MGARGAKGIADALDAANVNAIRKVAVQIKGQVTPPPKIDPGVRKFTNRKENGHSLASI